MTATQAALFHTSSGMPLSGMSRSSRSTAAASSSRLAWDAGVSARSVDAPSNAIANTAGMIFMDSAPLVIRDSAAFHARSLAVRTIRPARAHRTSVAASTVSFESLQLCGRIDVFSADQGVRLWTIADKLRAFLRVLQGKAAAAPELKSRGAMTSNMAARLVSAFGGSLILLSVAAPALSQERSGFAKEGAYVGVSTQPAFTLDGVTFDGQTIYKEIDGEEIMILPKLDRKAMIR